MIHMEQQQTAVDWLAKELESYGDPQVCEINWKDLDDLINQAKQIEKKQMHKCASFWRGKEGQIELPYFNLYYNDTYGTTTNGG